MKPVHVILSIASVTKVGDDWVLQCIGGEGVAFGVQFCTMAPPVHVGNTTVLAIMSAHEHPEMESWNA